MKTLKLILFCFFVGLTPILWAASTKEKLSLNFQSIPVHSALDIIAQFASLNIMVSDTVKGTVSLHLNNVPWDEALDIILKSQGLDKLQLGQVLVIASAEEIASRQEAALKILEKTASLEPLRSALIALNYAEGTEVVSLLKSPSNNLLSSRGMISVDKRTNSLLIEDTAERVAAVRNLIRKIDIPVKQVLIEARIVEVSRDFERSLGIRWRIAKDNHVKKPLDVQSSPLSHLNVNLPAQPISGQAASAGLALANLGQGYLLDLELSALESEGQGELISSPRLVTADQQEAFIEAGEEIPYQEASSSGATTVAFQQATLKLDVTPHITPDNHIMMAIKVNQDKPNAALDVQGTPAITTRKIDTKVRVANGETVVLGGIYRQEKINTVLRVPFLGELPWVGGLFRSTRVTDSRNELLIFITPKIVRLNDFDR